LDPVGIISSIAQRPAAAGEVQQAVTVAALKEGKLALDIRRQTDYDAGTVLNDRNVVFVIFSRSDEKASKAQEQLNMAGYHRVLNGGNYDELHNALYDTSDDPAQ
jgi:phage shock protein E